MAKSKARVVPARKSAAKRDDDSLLMQSAESFGRVIGSLQRSLKTSGAGTRKRAARKASAAKK